MNRRERLLCLHPIVNSKERSVKLAIKGTQNRCLLLYHAKLGYAKLGFSVCWSICLFSLSEFGRTGKMVQNRSLSSGARHSNPFGPKVGKGEVCK